MKNITKNFKSGFAAIIGCPNVGKSTLLNTIIGEKISIVTNKAQTTRNRIQGIFNDKESQIVLIDTPGIHKHKNVLGKYMNSLALKSLKGADLIIFITPVNAIVGDNEKFIIKQLTEVSLPIILVLSKMDLVSSSIVDRKILEWNNLFKFTDVIAISSIKKINISNLVSLVKTMLPNGPKYFSDNSYTDQPEKFIIKEIIREKILKLTEQEVPHCVAILINKIEENDKIMKIYASIIVERNSQKPIIIGKAGKLIKQIGIDSRKELETILNTRIHLDLFVKVEEKWRDRESILKKICYNKDTY